VRDRGQRVQAVIAPWQPVASAPEGVVVETVISDRDGERNKANLIRRGRLWFHADESMYVYYRPTHWRAASA
jgi:hypothetical protein